MLWPSFPHTKWILPHAPAIPITLNNGMSMPGWFDVNQLDRLSDSTYDDEAGILRSVAAVDALIQAEVDAGIPEDKIILGGFSQGGAISVLSGLAGKRKLGGVVGLSTWVVLNHKIESVSLAASSMGIKRRSGFVLRRRVQCRSRPGCWGLAGASVTSDARRSCSSMHMRSPSYLVEGRGMLIPTDGPARRQRYSRLLGPRQRRQCRPIHLYVIPPFLTRHYLALS